MPGLRYPPVLDRRFFAFPTYRTCPSASSHRYTPVFAGRSRTEARRLATCACASPAARSTASAPPAKAGTPSFSFSFGEAVRSSPSAFFASVTENSASVNWRSVKSLASAFHTGPTSRAVAAARARASAEAASAAAASATAPARFSRHARIARSTSSSDGAKTSPDSAAESSSALSGRRSSPTTTARPLETASIASRVSAISLAITSNRDSDALALPWLAVRGVTPNRSLCRLCFSRRRCTSATASRIAGVYGSSANRSASPRTLRAARPIICISERDERMKPGTPASRIATRLTCGISKPSRSNCAPTKQSTSPCCSACNFTARSFAVRPLCNQSARMPPMAHRYPARSSQSAFVKAHTRLASPRAARRRTAAASAGSCSFRGRIVTSGSSTPEGRTTMSTMPSDSSIR